MLRINKTQLQNCTISRNYPKSHTTFLTFTADNTNPGCLQLMTVDVSHKLSRVYILDYLKWVNTMHVNDLVTAVLGSYQDTIDWMQKAECCPCWRPNHKSLLCSKELYCQTSNISHTLEGNITVDHSDVVGASPVGTDPTTPSFLT